MQKRGKNMSYLAEDITVVVNLAKDMLHEVNWVDF